MAGSIGLGNIFVVINAVNSYGPSVIVWMWLGVIVGRFVKFWELYLSLKAKSNPEDFAGPIVYITQLSPWLGWFFIIFSLIYYVEIFQFNALISFTNTMIADYAPSLIINNFSYYLGLLIFIGIIYCQEENRFMNTGQKLMKIFLWGYLAVIMILLIKYFIFLPKIISDIILDTFQWNHISIKLLALMTGIKTAIYCNDIGVGYEGIMQKYARVEEKNYGFYCYQLINSNFIDLLVCTGSGLMVLFYYKIFNLSYGSVAGDALLINMFQLLLPGLGHFILWVLIVCAAFTTLCTLHQSGLLIFKYKYSNNHRWFYLWSGGLFAISMMYKGEDLFQWITLSGGLLVLMNCLCIAYILMVKKD